jgi:hypothetical protein
VNRRPKHALDRDLRQLRSGILPKAWAEVEPWVERWHAQRNVADEFRLAGRTSNIILAHMSETTAPQTPSEVASALAIPRECIKKAMQRLGKHGKLKRTPEGYKLP